jgi:hypothetical protein
MAAIGSPSNSGSLRETKYAFSANRQASMTSVASISSANSRTARVFSTLAGWPAIVLFVMVRMTAGTFAAPTSSTTARAASTSRSPLNGSSASGSSALSTGQSTGSAPWLATCARVVSKCALLTTVSPSSTRQP